GGTQIQTPFNYAKAHTWGVELTANYEHGPLEAYLNVARGQQKATRIVSNQFLIDPSDLAYIANHTIYTDHSQKWTISGGGALKLDDGIGRLTPSFDFVYGSGLRAADPAGIVPNGGTERPYLQVNLGFAQVLGHDAEKGLVLRFDVVNLFDKVYLIHSGSGVGRGQAEYGPRRGVFVGLRKPF
ncbi:MAG: TonB-dependent receptor, partial [Novosphingobium sp.]|nr:TonB-dependent receptor [Novosphingobium sp.]